jgi:hypothetical protein
MNYVGRLMAKQIRPKYSKDLLNLRKIQETLAKQKDYAEAHKMKLKADALEVIMKMIFLVKYYI